MALASPETHSRSGYPGVSSGAERRHDRTSQAVERQIEALGVEQFDIFLIDRNHNELHKTWNKEELQKKELQKSIPWLKRMNARGHNIGIKPHGEHGLVLATGFDEQKLKDLEKTGFKVAVAIEKSPGEYEAWIKLSKAAVELQIREAFQAKVSLSHGLGRFKEYGRLAGFTNQDPLSHREGLQPYVLAKEATGKVAEKGVELVHTMREKIEKDKLMELVQKRVCRA